MDRKLIQIAICLAAFATSAAAQTQTTVVTTSPTAGTVPVFGTTSGSNTPVSNSPLIVSGSNVGIGTTSPGGTLDVEGGTASSGSGSSIKFAAQNGQASGNTNGGNIILLPGANYGTGTPGYVGIGTATPGYPLEVYGITTNATTSYSLGIKGSLYASPSAASSTFYTGVLAQGVNNGAQR